MRAGVIPRRLALVYSDGQHWARLKFVAKQRWGLVMVGLGVLLLIPGLIVFARTGGGVTPALLISLVLLLVGISLRGRGPIKQSTPPIPPPPPPPSSASPERNEPDKP